jgi:hypothetical protein
VDNARVGGGKVGGGIETRGDREVKQGKKKERKEGAL